MKKSLRYNLVDVFTETPLEGNPLAVFTGAKGLSTEKMQAIAREMNLSETAFFHPPEAGGHVRVRIFTPRTELPFAGHPLIGSAWVLGQPMEMELLNLETGMGLIPVQLERAGGKLELARMTQPLPSFKAYEKEQELLAAVGLAGDRSKFLPTLLANNGPEHVLVEVESEEVLDSLEPDNSAMVRSSLAPVLVFAQKGSTCFARYFAPAVGISEDPATGSACGPLGAHLLRHGRLDSGVQLRVHQGRKMQRPSTLLVQAWDEDGALSRVEVAGAAVVIARGEMQVD